MMWKEVYFIKDDCLLKFLTFFLTIFLLFFCDCFSGFFFKKFLLYTKL